ncbi:hypothetical protein GCM10008939_22040 [Deinococcus aquiradiocola]|uniref:Winged helix-turn helix domain-containing protein n=2 Tax=Deinococcus aquiradiocola TaxID=393059 RepID=A0A917PGR0_9DEIO|nr:hypothetical protein GCM10008939_22040 [Deinococcus aquiradiocola]
MDALLERVHPGCSSAMTAETGQQLLARLRQDDQVWTARTVANWLEQEHGVALHPSTVRRQLLKLGLTWQRTRYVVAGRPDPQQQTEFLESVQDVKKGRSKG